MGKKALPLLTGGLNEKTRPDLIKDDQLQVCTNYEITGDGFLHRRKDVTEFDVALTAAIDDVFYTVSFVSEPYYPQTKIKISDVEMDSGYILFVFGTTSSGKHELHAFFTKDGSWTNVVNSDEDTLSELLSSSGIDYIPDSDIQMAVAQDSVFIADGINNTHMFTVSVDGDVRAGVGGIPSPTNKARTTEMTDWQPELWENTATESYLSSPGLFQCVYTVVTKTGEESNPSPLSDTLDMQFFSLDDDGVDERWINKITIKDLTVPNVPDNILEQLESFRVYMRVLRYSEGGDVKDIEFTEDFKITSKYNDDGTVMHYGTDTGNEYVVTVLPSIGDVVNYENDIAPVAKTVSQLGGITMVGNVKLKQRFPHNFKYSVPITLNNKDTKGYVDAVVKLRIWDKGVVLEGTSPVSNFSVVDFVTTDANSRALDTDVLKHIRIYDEDLTTPIMVVYNGIKDSGDAESTPDATNKYFDIYVKIPYLKAASSHIIYLVWTPSDEQGNYDGVPDYYNDYEDGDYTWDGNIGSHYGRFVQPDSSWDDWSRQQVWTKRKTSDGDLIFDDFEGIESQISNKADASISTLDLSAITIVDNDFEIPILGTDAANFSVNSKALKMDVSDSYVNYHYDHTVPQFDRVTAYMRINFPTLSTAYSTGRIYTNKSIMSLRYQEHEFIDFAFTDRIYVPDSILHISGDSAITFTGIGGYGDEIISDYWLFTILGEELVYNNRIYGKPEAHAPFYGYLQNVDDETYVPKTQALEGYLAISWDKTTSSEENRIALHVYYKDDNQDGKYRLATTDLRMTHPGTAATDRSGFHEKQGDILETINNSFYRDDECTLYTTLDIPTIDYIKIGFLGNIENHHNPISAQGAVYDDFRFTTNFFLDPENSSHNDMFINLANYMPGFENIIGYKHSDDSTTGAVNNNIKFGESRVIQLKAYENMVKWTDVNNSSFPDLFFKQVKEPVKKIMAAPSFLQFQYQNTFIIFTRNSINRFVLEGSASGWSGSSSSLIEEKTQYGLLADKSLVRAGDALFWLSEVGVIMWNKEGMNIISKNIIDVPIDDDAIAFYSPLNNQYILHYNSDSTQVETIEHPAPIGDWDLRVDIDNNTINFSNKFDNANVTEISLDGEGITQDIEDFSDEEVQRLIEIFGEEFDVPTTTTYPTLAIVNKNVFEKIDDNSFNINITLEGNYTIEDIFALTKYIKFKTSAGTEERWSVSLQVFEPPPHPLDPDAPDISVTSNGVSYVYHIERNAWTKFTGMSVLSASTLTGGERTDNINLLLDSGRKINKYPDENTSTSMAEIQTKDLFFEKGVLRKMKSDFVAGNTDVEMSSIMTKNDLSGNDIIKTNTITAPSPDHWRGIALANSRGKKVSFKIKNANIIKHIMYDLKVEE